MSPTDPASPALSIEAQELGVTYRGGVTALRDVSFALRQPTICGLIGMNGAGKSTLFKALMGLLPPATGSVAVCGQPPRWAQKRNVVAYVPQTEEVDWNFPVSVRDVVTMGRQGRMGFLRIPSRRDRDIVMRDLERVGMGELADRQIGELSGGQRKRVFLARALAQEARIMLLDEPFTGVDVTTERTITAILRELRAAGQLILVSTHQLERARELCDRALLINRTVVAHGPVDEVLTEPLLARTFDGSWHGAALRPPPGDLADLGLCQQPAS